jgi:UPF0716 protein FxsA
VLFKLLLLFIVVPLVELALLMRLSSSIGWQYTLGLVIVTGIFGSLLARTQGWRTWQRIQRELTQGQMPGESLLDAAMIFVAGALLLTPGILTDLFGFSLLVPYCRRFYGGRIIAYFKSRFTVQQTRPGQWTATSGRSQVIDSYVIEPPRPDAAASDAAEKATPDRATPDRATPDRATPDSDPWG